MGLLRKVLWVIPITYSNNPVFAVHDGHDNNQISRSMYEFEVHSATERLILPHQESTHERQKSGEPF